MGRDEHCEEEENALIGDVVLPPWASSAHQFIHTHREVKRNDDKTSADEYSELLAGACCVSTDSSVGRAVDCSGEKLSIGRWFESGSVDFFFLFLYTGP